MDPSGHSPRWGVTWLIEVVEANRYRMGVDVPKDSDGKSRKPECDGSQGVDSPTPAPSASEGASDASELISQIVEAAIPERREQGVRRASERRHQQVWNRFLLLAALVAILVTLPQYLGGRRGEKLEIPPDELLGTWVSDDPRYADRAITIRLDKLTLALGDGVTTVHMIRSIRGEPGPVHRAYEITYGSPEGDQVLEAFVYDDGLLRFKNPSEVVWKRTAN
jgi:hypothetical protein